MKKRYWIIGILILVCISLKFTFGRHTVKCPKINQEYFEWFPNKENDTLIFKNSDSIRKYEIKNLTISHRESYQNNLKCGCCEDGISLSYLGQNDTIHINFENFKNPNSCLADLKVIKRNGINLNIKNGKNYDDSNQINFGELLLEKNIGIKQILWNNKIWKLSNIKKGNSKNVMISKNGC